MCACSRKKGKRIIARLVKNHSGEREMVEKELKAYPPELADQLKEARARGTVTKRPVKAELIESLATGASKCAFRIRLI